TLCGYTGGFPDDDRFLGTTDFVLDWPGRDNTAIEEQLSYWIADQMGLPSKPGAASMRMCNSPARKWSKNGYPTTATANCSRSSAGLSSPTRAICSPIHSRGCS